MMDAIPQGVVSVDALVVQLVARSQTVLPSVSLQERQARIASYIRAAKLCGSIQPHHEAGKVHVTMLASDSWKTFLESWMQDVKAAAGPSQVHLAPRIRTRGQSKAAGLRLTAETLTGTMGWRTTRDQPVTFVAPLSPVPLTSTPRRDVPDDMSLVDSDTCHLLTVTCRMMTAIRSPRPH